MVESRVESLERSMQAVNLEIQLMSHTMKDIAETLREIKEDQKKIQKFEVEKAVLERDIKDLQNLVNTIFKKLDAVNTTLQTIKEQNASHTVKISAGERIMWIIVSAAIAGLGWFKG